MPTMRNNSQAYVSRCGDLKVRGTAKQIADKYAELSEQALKDKEDMQARIYSQYAEHWRKEI